MPHTPTIAFGRVGVLLVAAAACSCSRPWEGNADTPTVAEPVTVEADDADDIAESALDRSGFIRVMLDAAGAATVGADDKAAQQALIGRRFELRMRFGCPNAQPSSQRSWTFDPKSGALRVVVKPDIDEETELVASSTTSSATVRKVQEQAMRHRAGFLLTAPTVPALGCPTDAYVAAAGFTNLRFGIVQTTDPEAPRARQLLDSYEIVKKVAPEAAPTQGLDLIVRGRIESEGQDKPIVCNPRGNVVECLASATINQVAIENPASQRLIAEWGGS